MHSASRVVSLSAVAAFFCVLGCLEPTPDFWETLTDVTESSATSAPTTTSELTTTATATSETPEVTSSGATSSGSSDASTTMPAPCAGACDQVLELCNEEMDVCECREGFERCGETCVNLENDQGNCGACDMACGAPETCGQGECFGPQCPDSLNKCGKSCVDYQTDPLHCGACDSPCLATQSCAAGECV